MQSVEYVEGIRKPGCRISNGKLQCKKIRLMGTPISGGRKTNMSRIWRWNHIEISPLETKEIRARAIQEKRG
jgi:hypothetical protein